MVPPVRWATTTPQLQEDSDDDDDDDEDGSTGGGADSGIGTGGAGGAGRRRSGRGCFRGLLQGRDVAHLYTSSGTSIVPMRCAHKKTQTKGPAPTQKSQKPALKISHPNCA